MIDFKNYERLTISKGEIRFYEDAYNKCSNHNAPEIREKINSGALVCDINEYQSCSYTTKELKDIYTRLSQLEDMIEQGKLVEKSEPKTVKERVEIELEELREKTKKLDDFIQTSKFQDLSSIQKDLLVQQNNIMVDYIGTLENRLGNWEKV